MSTTFPADAGVPAAPTLASLRAELDRIDEAMHDLLMQRGATVARMAGLRAKGPVPLRPGREATVLRRLLRRHAGPLPSATVARVWREVVSACAALQGRMAVAVCEAPVDGHPGAEFAAAAREHFGALMPLRMHRTPAQAIRDVSAGVAAVAVLPLPHEDEPAAAAWWTALLHTAQHQDGPRISVVGRLPFWAARPEGAPGVAALLVSAAAADPSGDDRSLIGLELASDLSRARLGSMLAAAGLPASLVILRRTPAAGFAQALIDVAGFVADDDPRLAALASALRPSVLRPPVVLGAYAVPFQPAAPTSGSGT